MKQKADMPASLQGLMTLKRLWTPYNLPQLLPFQTFQHSCLGPIAKMLRAPEVNHWDGRKSQAFFTAAAGEGSWRWFCRRAGHCGAALCCAVAVSASVSHSVWRGAVNTRGNTDVAGTRQRHKTLTVTDAPSTVLPRWEKTEESFSIVARERMSEEQSVCIRDASGYSTCISCLVRPACYVVMGDVACGYTDS